jgi:hypothetical protein
LYTRPNALLWCGIAGEPGQRARFGLPAVWHDCNGRPLFRAQTVAELRAVLERVNSGSGCRGEQSYFERIPVVVDWWGVLLERRLAVRLDCRSAFLDHRECRLMHATTVFEEIAFAPSFATISTVTLNSIIHRAASVLSTPCHSRDGPASGPAQLRSHNSFSTGKHSEACNESNRSYAKPTGAPAACASSRKPSVNCALMMRVG